MIYRFDPFELNAARHELLRDGQPLALGQRAIGVLTLLVERAGQVVPKEVFLERVWPGVVVEENNLQVQVSTLRKVLGPGAILTNAGRGYCFTLDVTVRPKQPATALGAELIAVLPLENLSRSPQEEYFADGMTDALITDLATLGRLKVIARSSVSDFRGSKEPAAQIGRQLGASAVVEGSVMRWGHRIRISARLVRTATGEYLWAQRYDRDLADVLVLQDEVARTIARAIGQTLRLVPTEAPRRIDQEVYLLDLRGRHLTQQRTEAGYRAALKLFEEAAARDPSYAPAFVGIADSLNNLANHAFVAGPEVRARARAAVIRALELDDTSADAHRVMAFCESNTDWTRAIAEFERAIELNPHSSATNYWFGCCFSVLGQFERAQEMLARALELDPLSLIVPTVQGLTHAYARSFEEALLFFDRVLAVDPDFHAALRYQGDTLVQLGRYDEGIAALTRAYELGGRPPRLLGYLGYAYARSGSVVQARACAAELDRIARGGRYVSPYFPALVAAGLDEPDRALDHLERAHALGDRMVRDYLGVDPPWDRLRAQPRFVALIDQMDYPKPAF